MRLYDQLNYHLVVAKKILLNGSPFVNTFDSHIFLSGIVEYAFVWPRAFIDNDYFATPRDFFSVRGRLEVFQPCWHAFRLVASTLLG